MINYVYRIEKKTMVDKTLYNYSLYRVINDLSKPYFKTFDSMRKLIKEVLGINREIPLYISQNLLLVPIYSIRSKDAFYYNYFSLNSFIVSEFKTTLYFKNGDFIDLNVSKYRMNESIKKANIVLKYVKTIDK